jgi:hypothetical protein
MDIEKNWKLSNVRNVAGVAIKRKVAILCISVVNYQNIANVTVR